jgi:NAD-dependent deacetylase
MQVVPGDLTAQLARARRVTALTGSGISVESGVPTFRDARTGLWSRYRPEDLATPEAFARNPKLVWDWYAWRRSLCERAEPNDGHRALVEMSTRVRTTLITQNVDGLHQRAGSADVIELHGNITRVRCAETGARVDTWGEGTPPRHPTTGAFLRPDVVWFGEALPTDALEAAFRAAQLSDVFLCVGTSTVVYPAAQLPFEALRSGKTVIEINPVRTPLTERATFVLEGPSGVVLSELVRTTWS